MKGIRKLTVPSTPKTPKLYVFTVSRNGKQTRHSKVAWSLYEAVTSTWHYNSPFVMHEYISHTELSVNEINNLFKCFSP